MQAQTASGNTGNPLTPATPAPPPSAPAAPAAQAPAGVVGVRGKISLPDSAYVKPSIKYSKYKRPGKTAEIIGLLSSPVPVFYHKTITSSNAAGEMTQTTFDYTTRAGQSRILLTNGTASTLTMTDAVIRGGAVTRLSGDEGFVANQYIDRESIERDGERPFELGNRMIVTKAQVDSLEDWHIKRNREKLHFYSVSDIGFHSYFEPGEVYRLQVGGVGEAEYVDSLVECYGIRATIDADGRAVSTVTFREVMESWKKDSNTTARFVASGGLGRRLNNAVVYIAPQYYMGRADYYCDGTDDQVEINTALAYLSGAYGGGVVRCLRGNYSITSSITLLSNTILEGEGAGSTRFVSANAYDQVVEAQASALAYYTNIGMRDFTVDRNTTTPTAASAILAAFIDNLSIYGVQVLSPIYTAMNIQYANDVVVDSCDIQGGPSSITLVTNAAGILVARVQRGNIVNCSIRDMRFGGSAGTNVVAIGVDASSLNCTVSGNRIANILVKSSATTMAITLEDLSLYNKVIGNSVDDIGSSAYTGEGSGIRVWSSSNNNKIADNMIRNCKTYGIKLDAGVTSTMVSNNYCIGNGTDTGIANTNSNNYYDLGTDTQLG